MTDTFEFKSIDELYKRVTPALYSKAKEIRNCGYNYVNSRDIWSYLVSHVWNKKNDLSLSELVSDILYLDNYTIYEYVLEKMKQIKNNQEKKESTEVL